MNFTISNVFDNSQAAKFKVLIQNWDKTCVRWLFEVILTTLFAQKRPYFLKKSICTYKFIAICTYICTYMGSGPTWKNENMKFSWVKTDLECSKNMKFSSDFEEILSFWDIFLVKNAGFYHRADASYKNFHANMKKRRTNGLKFSYESSLHACE